MPVTDILPCSLSIIVVFTLCSSSGSTAVCDMMVNIVAYLLDAVFMIRLTFSLVGIIGIGGSYLSFGLSNGIWFTSQNME